MTVASVLVSCGGWEEEESRVTDAVYARQNATAVCHVRRHSLSQHGCLETSHAGTAHLRRGRWWSLQDSTHAADTRYRLVLSYHLRPASWRALGHADLTPLPSRSFVPQCPAYQRADCGQWPNIHLWTGDS